MRRNCKLFWQRVFREEIIIFYSLDYIFFVKLFFYFMTCRYFFIRLCVVSRFFAATKAYIPVLMHRVVFSYTQQVFHIHKITIRLLRHRPILIFAIIRETCSLAEVFFRVTWAIPEQHRPLTSHGKILRGGRRRGRSSIARKKGRQRNAEERYPEITQIEARSLWVENKCPFCSASRPLYTF